MKSAVITGATGFIGVHLAEELLSCGVRVAALCRENSPNRERLPPSVEVFAKMEELPKADVFYHLAWEGATGPGRADALLQARNAELALSALLCANERGCGRFIALGTIYERLVPQITAQGRFGGSDFYILSKSYAHAMTNQLARMLKQEYVWCTICHPIGELMKRDQLMASVISGLLAGESLALGPCETYYDIVAVEDVARGLRMLGQAGRVGREYYIGSGAPKPLREWLEQARLALGAEAKLGIGILPGDGLLFDKSWFDIAPLRALTGYSPQVGFEQAVANVSGSILDGGIALL